MLVQEKCGQVLRESDCHETFSRRKRLNWQQGTNMKSVALLVLPVVFIACVGAGCVSGEDEQGFETLWQPTKANFRNAIQKYLDLENACVEVDIEFPADFSEIGRPLSRKRSRYLDELVSIGLLSAADTDQRVHIAPLEEPRHTRLVSSTTYSLTEFGRSVSSIWITDLGETGTKFCYANYRVVEITEFSQPAGLDGNAMPERIRGISQTTVNYTFEVADIAEWARNSRVLRDYFDVMDRDLGAESKPLEGEAVLVLTLWGWMHKELLTPVWGSDVVSD